MRKIFVLDTSVLVYDPTSYKSFNGNDVLLPITVLEELDSVKKLSNDSGKNARVAIRSLDAISNLGEIHNGISIDNDIFLKIDTSAYDAIGSDPTYGDSKILGCAVKTKNQHPDKQVILVSKDINLRIKAKAFGLIVQDYEKDRVQSDDLYEGHRVIVDADAGDALDEAGIILIKDYGITDLYPNECVLFVDDNNKGVATGRSIKNQIKLIKDTTPWKLGLRNKEQLFAADLLLDPSIPLVSIVGRAGSGKTLISVACALELVLNKKKYDNLLIYRPIEPMGKDIGFTPGSIQEKLDPWFVPIDDAFSFLFNDRSRKKDGWKIQLHQYINDGTIQKEALTYIRGRSLSNSLIILDEAQNLNKDEIKAILTRVGNNSKIILTGDIEQIDNPHLDATNNGLSYVVNKFKNSNLAGHITLSKGERSELATIASTLL